MLVRHRGAEPEIHESAYVAPTAVLVGDVRIAERARLMYGAVFDSEGSTISVGECSIICENAVVRATAMTAPHHPVTIEDHVFIGPHATVLGCTLERNSYVATGATILQGAKVGAGSVIAVGALVHANAVVPEGTFIPPNAVAIGDPVKLYGASDSDLVRAIRDIGFPRLAFGIEPDLTGKGTVCHGATEVRSKEFEAHFDDILLEKGKPNETN